MLPEPDHLKPFLDSLARMAPHPGQLDRDALLFDAGRRAGRRGLLWPLTVGALALLSAGLSTLLALRAPAVVEVERIVYLPAPVPVERTESVTEPVVEAVAPSPDWIAGLKLRQRVVREGVNALSATTWFDPPTTREDVPDFAALRLNAPATKGDRFR